mmetsp:Transcript_56616/g.149223  ORF Transcript_56616/g.149223 Transcript_56616/m.149223 type:complete len:83 (-) Transcript_56616:396-644(-)
MAANGNTAASRCQYRRAVAGDSIRRLLVVTHQSVPSARNGLCGFRVFFYTGPRPPLGRPCGTAGDTRRGWKVIDGSGQLDRP